MRSITVLNAKGGCGKTTLSTNLASYFAAQGRSVLLADFDPQGSSLAWLAERPAARPAIRGVAAWKDPVRAPAQPDYLIADAPAATQGAPLAHLLRHAESVLIPVLPSPIDIRVATRFIGEVLTVRAIVRSAARVAVVANRVREHTLIYQELERFLRSLDIPFIATLRETQNYIHAARQGLGIFELPPTQAAPDAEQWQPLINWLRAEDALTPARQAILPASYDS